MGTDSTAMVMNAPVGELAFLDLHACALFHGAGIDFRDGHRTIQQIWGVPGTVRTAVTEALAALDLAPADIEDSRANWQELDTACGHLVRVHHAALRRSLMELRCSFPDLASAEPSIASSLTGARAQLTELVEDVQVHFAKEENILFPALSTLAEAKRLRLPPPALPFPSVVHPIRVMEADHARIEERVQSLSAFIAHLAAAPDMRERWSRWQFTLSQFACELAAHARFESEWLFPHALEIELALTAH